jgi:hypothetical protein
MKERSRNVMKGGDMRSCRLARSGSRLNILVNGEKSRGSSWALSGRTVCHLYTMWSSTDKQIPMS